VTSDHEGLQHVGRAALIDDQHAAVAVKLDLGIGVDAGRR
jgi:hypothetical protein